MASLSPPISPQQSRSERPDRPRAVTNMSYASTHSHKSSKSREEKKLELTETARDKRRLEGKSDPTKALREREPAAVALEDSNLENIRSLQHKDKEGNYIVDPDRSNPTRPRMERPLDTIRSFNAAAEGTSSRRTSYQRQSSQVGWENQVKRTSYYGHQSAPYSPNGRPGPGPGPRSYSGQGGYYRNSSYGNRPDSYGEEGAPRQQYQQQHYRDSRYQQGPAPYMQGESPNSLHAHQQSYETMTSGSDEMSKSTNPSSQNSSFDQLHQMGRQKPDSGYYENNPYRQTNGARPMRNPYPPSAMPNGFNPRQVDDLTDDYGMSFSNSEAPPPPAKNYAGPMSPSINLNGNGGPGGRLQKTTSMTAREQPKRQSWIKRTFSKRS